MSVTGIRRSIDMQSIDEEAAIEETNDGHLNLTSEEGQLEEQLSDCTSPATNDESDVDGHGEKTCNNRITYDCPHRPTLRQDDEVTKKLRSPGMANSV